MAEKVEVDIEVNSNIEPSIKALKELKKQLKETAAGSDEFKKISKNIKDVEDSLEESRAGAKGFTDMLEEAPGPLGQLFGGLRKAEIATKGFGTALKATGIGLIVAAIGGLVAAFSEQEGAMKKLEPLMIGMEKILGGIFAAVEPLLDVFLELAMQALPYITKGIGIFYSVLVGLFNLVKNVGVGVGKILKGIFTLDFSAVTEGYDQIKNAIPEAMDAGKAAFGRYEEGTKRLTKTEKENLKARSDANKNALDEKKKQMEAQDKLDEAALEKLKTEALAIAETEQEKFDIEKEFAEKLYQLKLKDLEDRLKLEKKGTAEYKAIQAEIIKLQSDKLAADAEFAAKGKEIAAKAAEELAKQNDEALNKAELDLNLKKEQGLLKEGEYQQALYDMRVKYANSNEDLIKAEIDLLKFKNDEKKRLAEEERQTALNNIQAQFDELDRANKLNQVDFQQDLERLAQQKDLLNQQEAIELQNQELTEFQKTEIRKKYADARRGIAEQEVVTEKAAADAKRDIQMQYLGLFEQFGSLLGEIAGKNKTVAIAGLLIEKAAAIGKIITQMMSIPPVLPPGVPNPAFIPSRIAGALSIASTIASTAKQIQQINQAAASAGAKGGGGSVGAGGGAPNIPMPTVAGAAAPQIQTTGGMNPSTAIGETIASAQNRPIRAYVVSGEVTSQQALDRRTSAAATFSGG